MSTLPPEPSYDANIPIISSAGGTSVAYLDPNSPESIMKKTTLVQAQGRVDTKYDVDLKKVKENFSSASSASSCLNSDKKNDIYILYIFVTLLLMTLFTQTTQFRKLFVLSLASLLLVITIYLLQKDVRY
jgi:hypothetical protein